MDLRVSLQLEKVLALADSSHDGEALGAVRKARQILSRDGLSFTDLAKAATANRTRINLPFSLFSNQTLNLETQVVQLRQKLDDAQVELEMQAVQLEFWRRRAAELEQNATTSTAEAVRWRQLAQETVDKLWDVSQAVQSEEFISSQPANLITGRR